MKRNAFMMIMPYRKQPNQRMRCCRSPQNTMNNLVSGMVTFGSIAVLGGTAVGIMNAFNR